MQVSVVVVLAAAAGVGALSASVTASGEDRQIAPAERARIDNFGGGQANWAAPAKPAIKKKGIPYPKSRKRDMARYSKRHYGHFKWRLRNPKLIVMHYAVAGSIGSIYNTFAHNRPDPEFHEKPNVCSHFAASAGGGVFKFVPVSTRCRHVVGLNHVAIGIEHVGFSDSDVLNRPAQLNASLKLTQWLRCRFGIPVEGVIGHAESLSSPYYKERDPRFKGRTHGDFKKGSMDRYRGDLQKLGSC